jgi:feruloyl esterase
LTVVKPVVDCAKFESIDITDIGGTGSFATSATVSSATNNGASVNFCTVKGTIAAVKTFEMALPVDSWKRRFAEVGCGGLCGNLSDPMKPS